MDNQLYHYEPVPDPRIVHLKNENKGVLGTLARARNFRNLFPDSAKRFLRRFLSRDSYNKQLLLADPFYYAKKKPDYTPKYDVQIGILYDYGLRHKFPMAACLDLGVDYQLVDITAADWIERIKACPCEIYMIHPTMEIRFRKQMYEERLRILTEILGKKVFPDYLSLWIYESKHRMHYWLRANRFPSPQTWVFYDADSAVDFCRQAHLPIVYKSDMGAGASGVKIFRERQQLLRFVKNHFTRGFARRFNDPRDREWGCVLLQEYIPDAREWRMIRIGDSFFGYEKIKVGQFHSGSHVWNYSRPSDELLNLLREITDAGNFKSMDLDIFIAPDGRLLVSEMQTVFGMGNPYEMCVVDGKPGRMLWESDKNTWRFEEGRFCQNWMWNLRLEYLLKVTGCRISEKN